MGPGGTAAQGQDGVRQRKGFVGAQAEFAARVGDALGAISQRASFVVNGAAQASDSALVTASAEMKWTSGWSAAATFEGEFSDVTRRYAGKGQDGPVALKHSAICMDARSQPR